MKTIYGEAVLDGVPAPIEQATLVIRVEDCGRADAAAVLVLEHRIAGISRGAGNADPVQFALSLSTGPPAGGTWSLRLRLCRDPAGELQPGDYVSARRYPLTQSAASGHLRISLQRLG